MNFILNPENTPRHYITADNGKVSGALQDFNQDAFESWIRTLTLPELYRYQGAPHCWLFLWSLSRGEESNYPLVSLVPLTTRLAAPQHHEKCLVTKIRHPPFKYLNLPDQSDPICWYFCLKKIWQPVLLCCCGRLYLRDERTLPQSVLGINQHSCRVLS